MRRYQPATPSRPPMPVSTRSILVFDSVGPQAVSVTDVTNGFLCPFGGASRCSLPQPLLAVVEYPSPSTAGGVRRQ